MAGPRQTLTRQHLRAYVQASLFPEGMADRVGAEVELTPWTVTNGQVDIPAAPAGSTRLWEAWPGKTAEAPGGPISWRGGHLTREPGGQFEFSGPPMDTPEATACVMSQAVDELRDRARQLGFDFMAVGLHPWATAAQIGLHAQSRRYVAMNSYFGTISPYGQMMMRLTGSVQVTVDHGGGDVRLERWELAQRLAPVLTAAFGNSAVTEGHPAPSPIMRARVWLELDPRRTGIPRGFLDDPTGDPIDQYLQFALDAPVMFVSHPDRDHEVPAEPTSFQDWMNAGMAAGYPDLADWKTHLTTLFPDVRPQGYLEARAMDAPGLAWTGVPILVFGHALLNPTLRQAMLEQLRPHHEELLDLRLRAAGQALSDPTLRELARALFKHVRGVLEGPAEALVAAYDERYIQPGLTPGEELQARIPLGGVLEPAQVESLEEERLAHYHPCGPQPALSC